MPSGLQQALGISSEVIDVKAASELVPQLETADLVGASFCPSDGYAAPEAVVQGYATAARRLGVKVRLGCTVTGIRTAGDRIIGVDTDDGPVGAPTVVCAAGVRSAELARMIGFDLPVRGEARTIYYSSYDGGIPDGAPLTVDFTSGFYFRREGTGVIFAGRERDLEDLWQPAVKRLPMAADLPIVSSWWGYYDMSPDCNAMIGALPEQGFYYATGFSGHGFQLSPAAGEHVAELVLDRATALDLAALSAERFPAGELRVEKFVI